MLLTGSNADITSAVRDSFHRGPPEKLGVAVSGGGDSVALLRILKSCFDDQPTQLHAVTVDHGLRVEAQQEAAWVADLCEALGVAHSTLRWRGWSGTGNLQDQARQARYQLMTDWAHNYGINDIALGHTADDQAETFLMRLARASGVDGLAAMNSRRTINGVNFIRPMLELRREDLRQYLRAHDQDWVEDPSNQDLKFDRIKARRALDTLDSLGISVQTLTDVARHMEQAREALDWYSFLAAREFVHVDGGDVLIEYRRLRTLPAEIARRLLTRAIAWVNGQTYPPRSASLARFVDAAQKRETVTLAGCQMLHQGPYVWICREYNAVLKEFAVPPATWDNRWRVTGPDTPGCLIKPLGRQGLEQCKNWRETGRPYTALLASPSIWRGGELLSAPLAGNPSGWDAAPVANSEEFFAGILSH